MGSAAVPRRLRITPCLPSSWAARRAGLRAPLALAVPLLAFVLFAVMAIAPRAAQAHDEASAPDPMVLEVPGFPDAYYVRPRTKARRPVILYLHGRGGNAFEDCRKWARVARQFGWIVCPQGPALSDNGGRTWNNDAVTANRIIDATTDALREKYKGRV